MGERLANEIEQRFKKRVWANPVWRKSLEGHEPSPSESVQLVEVVLSGMHESLLHLARLIPDPEGPNTA